jgi:REP element-mobilizing transposase RayT
MDAGHGSCILREPAIAQIVQDALLFFDAERYRVFAWTVMPNHVHVLFQPCNGWSVAKIVASWKKFTARSICDWRKNIASHEINNPRNANQEIGDPGNANLPIGSSSPGNADLLIGSSPPVWHREYWDRYMRDARHFRQAMDYIHQNPVNVGLVAKAEDWPWSSAARNPGTANLPIGSS